MNPLAAAPTEPPAVVAPSPKLPAPGLVFTEQLRTVGLAIRREGFLFAAAMVALVIAVAVAAMVPSIGSQLVGELPPSLNPEELGMLAAVIGLAFPLAVWKNERPWGDTTLWTLPVPHSQHALAKIAAGWLWLIGVITVGLLAFCAAALLAGGELGIDVTRPVLANPEAVLTTGAQASSEIVSVQWTTPVYQWLMPFTGATVMYLFGSALWVGTRHPLRWAVVIWLSGLFAAGFFDLTQIDRIEHLAMDGLHGFDSMLTSGYETLRTGFRRADGDWTTVWTELPTFGGWIVATMLWTLGGLAAVTAAVRRQRRR